MDRPASLPPQPPGNSKARGSWLTIVLTGLVAIAFAIVLTFLTLGFVWPFVVGAAIFGFIGLQYVVWGWWFERIYRSGVIESTESNQSVTAAGRLPAAARPAIELGKIYPYIVPSGYIDKLPATTDGFVLPLGHDVFAMLVHDLDGLCRNVFEGELAEVRLDAAQAHRRALANLEQLAEGNAIQKALYRGPEGMPFILWSGHWLAASCARLPSLHAIASEILQTTALCVSIPHRESLLIFPQGTRQQRDQMREIIRRNEGDANKPITWELFKLTPTGLAPLVEA